jgi:hypothetical protein
MLRLCMRFGLRCWLLRVRIRRHNSLENTQNLLESPHTEEHSNMVVFHHLFHGEYLDLGEFCLRRLKSYCVVKSFGRFL